MFILIIFVQYIVCFIRHETLKQMTKVGIKEIYYTYKYTLGICYEKILKTYLTENNLFNLLTLLRRHKYYFFKTKFMVLY